MAGFGPGCPNAGETSHAGTEDSGKLLTQQMNRPRMTCLFWVLGERGEREGGFFSSKGALT